MVLISPCHLSPSLHFQFNKAQIEKVPSVAERAGLAECEESGEEVFGEEVGSKK